MTIKMKLKFLTLILMGLLLTGCAKNVESPDEVSSEVVSETESTEVKTEDTIETTTESSTQEEEPYIVTFEANTI